MGYIHDMAEDTPSTSDIRAGDWIDRRAPAAARPYLRLARLDRPIGWWLLLLPCWWGEALASEGWPDVLHLVLFWVGAVVMRGAGCVINDIADRDFDGRVARTASRPLPSGTVRLPGALVFLVVLLVAGLAVLVQFNRATFWIATASLPLIAVYPLMKRITYWPQAWLGIVFNWGALVGWAAVRGSLDGPALALYAAGFFWTLGYDTIYAHQDRADDLIAGVKSTALLFGERTRPWLFAFYGMATILFAAAAVLADLAWPFYLGLMAAAAHLGWQAATVDIGSPADCLGKFRSNRLFGMVVLAAIVAARVAGPA